MNKTKNKPRNEGGKAKPKPTFRSRVTAGLTLLPSIDGRSTWARIMRDTYHAMLAHAGGADYVSETKRLMARRVAACEAELIRLGVQVRLCSCFPRNPTRRIWNSMAA